MARRRNGDAPMENGKNKEEEIDTYRTVYIDTNLDTHLALVASELDSVLDLKKKVMLEHLQCFPKLGEIIIHALKVKRKGHFYHLSDSMRVNRAFEGVKNSWFLSVDASYSKHLSENEQSCRPNMSNHSPVLCLPYYLANTECNNDDASTSAILKSASVERLSNQKVQPIPQDPCKEFSEDIVTNHECSGTDILKIVSADLNKVPDLPSGGTIASNIQCSNSVEPSTETGSPVKKKKQKIKKHSVDELGDCPAKKNIAPSHVSAGEALCHEILLSANLLVCAEKAESKEGDALLENRGLFSNPTEKTSKEETILPKDQYESQIIASNTKSPESTDADQMTMSLRTETMKSRKKRKRDEMNLSGADNHEAASLSLSVKDSAIEDGVKEKNIPSNHVTGEVSSPQEILVPLNLLVNTESNEHKEIGDPLKENKVPVPTSKEEIKLPRSFEEQNNSPKTVLDTLSSKPADNPRLRTSPGIKNKRDKKKKKDVKRKKDVTFNLPSAAVFPSSVQDAGGDESLQEKNIALNHVSGEDESQHEVSVPIHLIASAERTEHEGTSGDALKENKILLVSTNETSTQEIGLTEKSIEDRHDSQKIVVDTLSSAAADSEHLRTGTGIRSKKNKKKRKADAIINISNSAKDAEGAEGLNDKKSALNNVSAEDEEHPESAVLANLLVDGERTDCQKIRDFSEQDKKSVPSNKTSTRGTGLSENTVEDQHIVVSGTLSPEHAKNEHLRTNSSIKHKKSKKKSKRDTTVRLSIVTALPSSAQDVLKEESYKEKNITLNNGSGKDESHLKIAVPANLLVYSERTEHEEFSGNHLEQNKGSVSKRKNTSTQEFGLKLNSVQDHDNSQKVVLDTLSPELADSGHPGTYSKIKKMKPKKKRKMDATSTLSGANVFPSSVQDAAGEESLKDKNIPLHEDQSHHETVIHANFLVNAERPEREEITGDPLEKDKVGFKSSSTSIEINLDRSTEPISKKDDSVNVQSAKIIKDKSRKDQANSNTPSQPAVSESGSDRIDFKHYFLPGKAEDKVAGSDKSGITRSERDDKTKKKTKKSTPLLTSHDQELTPQSSNNQEGGVKSHIKCSGDTDPQESFSKDASSGSLHPPKKSTSNVYRKRLPSSLEPAGRLVACAKGSAKGTSEVKSRPLHKKSLLTITGSIFKDDSSDSSDDEEASEQFNARTPSEDVLSSDSDRESDRSLDSPTNGSSGLDKKEDVENMDKKRSSNLRNTTMNMVLRSSSRYKKAKCTAESQPEVEDSESQPVDCVPDSQANP